MPWICIIFCTIPGIYSIIRQKGYGWRCSGMENPPCMSKYNNSGDVCGGRWDEPQKPRELQFPEVDSKTRYRPLRKLIKIRGWPWLSNTAHYCMLFRYIFPLLKLDNVSISLGRSFLESRKVTTKTDTSRWKGDSLGALGVKSLLTP